MFSLAVTFKETNGKFDCDMTMVEDVGATEMERRMTGCAAQALQSVMCVVMGKYKAKELVTHEECRDVARRVAVQAMMQQGLMPGD